MIALIALLGAPALAQSTHPRVFEIPDPEAVPEPELPPEEAPPPMPDAAATPLPVATATAVRRGPREVQGDAPSALSGRWSVVQVTEAGQTDDFRIKMERAGRALQSDCITVRMIFDFGGGAGLPERVTIAEQQECRKGGLGTYANEIALTVPARWSVGEGGAKVALPEAVATAELTRLKRPDDGDMRTPSQWLSSETKLSRQAGEVGVRVETRGRAGAPSAVHLLMGDLVYHLEPEAAGSPFAP